jgi:XRE family transcriptional regulator, aerobic/anaerobic benzoate catabolism transcriptional regulator
MVFDLIALGHRVRSFRVRRGMTSKDLAEASGVSLRFLSQLENGQGNISISRLSSVAEALRVPLTGLLDGSTTEVSDEQRSLASEILALSPERFDRLSDALVKTLGEETSRGGVLSLLGVRGAGKSSVGARAAEILSIPFVELDGLVEQEAGLSLSEIFAIHGEAYYREVELRMLERFLATSRGAVLATGGSLVSHPRAWERLQRETTTIWLRADAQALWERVVAQGDLRPMRENPNAFSQLEALVDSRTPLYERADVSVDTTLASVEAVVSSVVAVAGAWRS